MKKYDGPSFYVSCHEVYKPDSASTPVRLVVNSSLRYKGIGLNGILMKGPNSLQDLFGIQIRARKDRYMLVCDLKKYYHSVYTTEAEKHVRRLVWRSMKLDEPPKTYGFERVTFGDKPAGAICSAAVKETADIYSFIDKDAADKIRGDAYVDDIVTGDDSKERIEELKISIPEILGKTGFKIKGFVASGDKSDEALALLRTGEMGRVLGISWDPRKDQLSVTVKINLSKKHKGSHTEPELTYEQIPKIVEMKLTR